MPKLDLKSPSNTLALRSRNESDFHFRGAKIEEIFYCDRVQSYKKIKYESAPDLVPGINFAEIRFAHSTQKATNSEGFT